MPDEATQLLAKRVHDILAKRKAQLERNLACFSGGDPYITLRLARFPCEPESNWSGTSPNSSEGFWGNLTNPTGVQGRKDRAYMVNYAARIINKFNQFVFSADITREGIDPTFQKNATRTNLNINQTMRRLAGFVHAGQWAWIGIDRMASKIDPATGQPTVQSLAEKAQRGDRIFWTVWKSTEVVDWSFDANGRLAWLITEQVAYDNADPRALPKTYNLRTLWEPGKYTRITSEVDKPGQTVKTYDLKEGTIGARIVPFIPVGVPSLDPFWYDDIERIQASILNLESAHNENLIGAVFPQLVIPHELVESIMQLAKCEYNQAIELVRGLNFPILEPGDSKGITRYITPSAQDLKAIPDHIQQLRRDMYDTAGVSMQNRDTRQVQSAAAKAWDFLDTEAALKDHSQEWRDAELQGVELSRELDPTFPEYDPTYPTDFDIGDIKEQMEALLLIQNLDLPESGIREGYRAAVSLQSKLVRIPPDRLQAIYDDIDTKPIGELSGIADMFKAAEPPAAQPQ